LQEEQGDCSQWQQRRLLRCSGRRLHSLRCRLWGWRPRFAGLRGPWPGRLHPGDYIQVRRLRRRFFSAPPRLHLPDHDVLSSELVVLDPISSVAVVWGSDIATIRLRIGLRAVGDLLVSSTTGVLLLNDGKGLQHSAPHAGSHGSTHTISNTSADSTANSATDSAYHKTTQRTSGSLQLCRRSRGHLGPRQENVVLPSPPPRLPSAAHHLASSTAYCTGRSLQLR